MDPTPEQVAARTDKMSLLSKTLAATSDPETRKLLIQALVTEAKQMINEIRNPFDAVMDQVVVGYTIAATLSLLEIGVFDAIPPTDSMCAKDLAVQCNADEELIVRLMRQLTCVNVFTEVKLGEWSHNRLSFILSKHIGDTGKIFYHVCFDEMLPSMMVFHRYIREFGNKDVRTYTNTPHSWYNKMLGKNFWEVLDSSPKRLAIFNKCLQQFADLHPVVQMFPYQEALKEGNRPDRPLMVDIGGGNGQAITEMRRGCPNLQGEMILQDRPEVIANIKTEDLPGVTKMPHDFFTQQPVKNAQIYYIRRVMHDWQDEDAAKIMKAIIPAMAPDSRILISDMKIPEPVSLQDAGAVWLDLMLLGIGGKERTGRDWARLADLTGLKLIKIWDEPEKFGTLCVVEYMLKDFKTESEKGEVVLVPVAQTNRAASVEPDAASQQEIKNAPVTNGISSPRKTLVNGVDHLEINRENEAKADMALAKERSVEVGG